MSDVDTSAYTKGLAEIVEAETRKAFASLVASGALPVAMTDTDDQGTDDAVDAPQSIDPIDAARKRASILAGLRKDAPTDPRVMAVFETDPIVAEDPATGNLVTQRMLSAREDAFDAVLTMLGRPVLARGARSRLAITLKSAFTMLSDEAQVEWAMSEVRLEEIKVFLDRRSQADLNALGQQLEAIYEHGDLWAAARAFTLAAHIGVGDQSGTAVLPDLLEMRAFD